MADDPGLEALQEEWAPDWLIWRARCSDDPPGARTGEFVAARTCDEAGAERTIARPTAGELDAVLCRLQWAGLGSVATRVSLPVMWALK